MVAIVQLTLSADWSVCASLERIKAETSFSSSKVLWVDESFVGALKPLGNPTDEVKRWPAISLSLNQGRARIRVQQQSFA